MKTNRKDRIVGYFLLQFGSLLRATQYVDQRENIEAPPS